MTKLFKSYFWLQKSRDFKTKQCREHQQSPMEVVKILTELWDFHSPSGNKQPYYHENAKTV